MVKQALDWLGAIDGVAYNVGIPGPKGLPAMTPDAWDATLDVNLRGAMLTARASLPVMESGSALVFTSSIASVRPTGRQVAYEASKAALGAVMRAVAVEGKDRSIRSNIVMPGIIDTGLGRNANRELPFRTSLPIPLGRQGTAWEVAYAGTVPTVRRIRLHHRADSGSRRRSHHPMIGNDSPTGSFSSGSAAS